MLFVQGSKVRPKQIRLSELFTVDRVLSSRGFSIASEGNGEDLIFPRNMWTGEEADSAFEAFQNLDARRKLLSLANGGQDDCENDLVRKIQAVADFKISRQIFSSTFEWYIGELLVRSFGAFSSSYSVKVENTIRNSDGGTSGDFDVLSILGNLELLYVECKSGTFKKSHVLNSIERCKALHCIASIIIAERGCNSINVRQMIKGHPYPGWNVSPELVTIAIKGDQASQVIKWHDVYFISNDNASEDIEKKLRTVLRLIAASRTELMRDIAMDEDTYRSVGYDVIQL